MATIIIKNATADLADAINRIANLSNFSDDAKIEVEVVPAPPAPYVPLGELEYLEIRNDNPCLYIKTGGKNEGDGVARSWSHDPLHEYHFRRLHHEHEIGMKYRDWRVKYQSYLANTGMVALSYAAIDELEAIDNAFDAGPKE